jgi:hypothetical protein
VTGALESIRAAQRVTQDAAGRAAAAQHKLHGQALPWAVEPFRRTGGGVQRNGERARLNDSTARG